MNNTTTAQVLPVQPSERLNFKIRRPKLKKPANPVQVSKEATSDEAIFFLNEFMKEARKEIRKREKITMLGNVTKTDCNIVTFLGESFSLTINFKERGTKELIPIKS